MTEKLGVNEKEPAFGQKTPTTMSTRRLNLRRQQSLGGDDGAVK